MIRVALLLFRRVTIGTINESRAPVIPSRSYSYTFFMYPRCRSTGADLCAEDRQGQTPLSWACLKGRVAIAQYLLDRGAPIDHADKSGKTALDLATLNGNPALVQVSRNKEE